MQRQCSTRVVAFVTITSGVFAYGKFASGINSRRLNSHPRRPHDTARRQRMTFSGGPGGSLVAPSAETLEA